MHVVSEILCYKKSNTDKHSITFIKGLSVTVSLFLLLNVLMKMYNCIKVMYRIIDSFPRILKWKLVKPVLLVPRVRRYVVLLKLVFNCDFYFNSKCQNSMDRKLQQILIQRILIGFEAILESTYLSLVCTLISGKI